MTALILYMCKATKTLPFSEQIFSFPSKFLAEFGAISSELVRTSCAEAQSRTKRLTMTIFVTPKSANYTKDKTRLTLYFCGVCVAGACVGGGGVKFSRFDIKFLWANDIDTTKCGVPHPSFGRGLIWFPAEE